MADQAEQLIRLLAQHFVAHQEATTSALAAVAEPAVAAGLAIIESLRAGGKVIAFGNGGSATQASHLAGELIGRFRENRRPYPAIALSSDSGSVTCIANDFGFDALFARQVEALAQPRDVVIGITTSGRSQNVLRGLAAAQKAGATAIALTGASGLVDGSADHIVAVPSTVTAHVQELHLMVIHVWCAAVDDIATPA
jgi:D-sedoheptulose 7-phosphate isomerase